MDHLCGGWVVVRDTQDFNPIIAVTDTEAEAKELCLRYPGSRIVEMAKFFECM